MYAKSELRTDELKRLLYTFVSDNSRYYAARIAWPGHSNHCLGVQLNRTLNNSKIKRKTIQKWYSQSMVTEQRVLLHTSHKIFVSNSEQANGACELHFSWLFCHGSDQRWLQFGSGSNSVGVAVIAATTILLIADIPLRYARPQHIGVLHWCIYRRLLALLLFVHVLLPHSSVVAAPSAAPTAVHNIEVAAYWMCFQKSLCQCVLYITPKTGPLICFVCLCLLPCDCVCVFVRSRACGAVFPILCHSP